MDEQNKTRLEKIAGFVAERLEQMAADHPSPDRDPAYRWEHTQRVAQYGRQLARAEGADIDVVVAACLLHDVSHFDPLVNYNDHGRLGAEISRPFLETLGYTSEQIDDICYAIAMHVDGDAGYAHEPTLEASIVSDADNIDRFGAYRILWWCVPEMNDLPALTEKLRQRLVRLEKYRHDNPLETVAGRLLFARQLDRQIAFFQDLITEAELTRLFDEGTNS